MADLRLDIVTYLTNEGVVTGDGTDTFRDVMPETPVSAVAVYEYSGGPPAINEDIAQRSIQIVARDTSAVTALNKAKEIYAEFIPPGQRIDLTSERWCLAYPRQTPIRIKVDSNNRVYYGFNMGITTNID